MIGIIGAGITGLSLAWKLKKNNIPFVIIDKNPGGLIQTKIESEFLLENGPNSLIYSPELEELIVESNFQDQVIFPSILAKKRFILFRGKPIAIPTGPISLLMNPLFSWKSILNLWKERNNKSQTNENETVAEFFDRRFGKEIRENLVNPFVSGIYAGDPEKMLVSLSFPTLVEMEKQHGSVIRGAMKSKNRPKTINFKNGIGSFIKHLVTLLKDHVVFEEVQSIEKIENKYKANDQIFDQIILCTPAYVSGKLLKNILPNHSKALEMVHYPPVAQVYLAFRDENLSNQTKGFGLLTPAFEKTFCLGILFSSQLFENRSRTSDQLLTAFVGGDRHPDYALLPEDEIVKRVKTEIQKIYNIQSEPVFSQIKVYKQAIPQPDLHMKNARNLCKNVDEPIFFAGNWISGVAVSDCIRYAFELADKLD